MDQHFHLCAPVPVAIDKLVKHCSSENPHGAFLFEPIKLIPFEQAWSEQQHWQQYLLQQPLADEAVWLLQHPACYTLGRGANINHVHFDPTNPPAPLHRIDRGGEVTYHLPGQLVAYPVLNLQRHVPDLHWYLRQLEQVIIDVLFNLGLKGERLPGFTGLWLEGRKVAAIGVGCRRWITQHGLALNVSCDLRGFSKITPCGIAEYRIGRLCDWLPGLAVSDVQPLLRNALASRFHLTWTTQTW
ncbi:lipoyl(octanoyl) transferase LipB [Synechococcus sp. M16CYN]|uniref:lipoyl(octanoyl) transferase LipB n=1 Tax=Synechococcus sp. M16CYN TaxID=3103139 RepID=UPI0032445095